MHSLAPRLLPATTLQGQARQVPKPLQVLKQYAGTWAMHCSKPAGFDVALPGDGQPTGLTLLAMKDANGPYLTVDADAGLREQFGNAALAGKFRHCP
jgi:hypothetical protein